MRRTGFEAIPGGRTGDTYFCVNGWKVVLDLTKVKISGVLYSDNFATAYFSRDLVEVYPAVVSALVSIAQVPATVTATDIRQEIDTNSVKLEQVKTLVEDTPSAIWNTPSNIVLAPGSFGHFLVSKILTVSKFIGLK
jgi:hypothetical protein